MFEESCLSPQLPYIAINRMRYAGNLEQVRTSIVWVSSLLCSGTCIHARMINIGIRKEIRFVICKLWHFHSRYFSDGWGFLGSWQSSDSVYWVTVAPIINSPCVHVHVYVYVSYYHIMLEMLLLKATRKQHEVCGGPGESLQQMTVMSLK